MVTVLCAVIIYSGIIYAKRIKIDIISLYVIVTCEAFEVNKKIYTSETGIRHHFGPSPVHSSTEDHDRGPPRAADTGTSSNYKTMRYYGH